MYAFSLLSILSINKTKRKRIKNDSAQSSSSKCTKASKPVEVEKNLAERDYMELIRSSCFPAYGQVSWPLQFILTYVDLDF